MSETGAIPHPVDDEPELSRKLANRHIQLIAIGGAIGTGLFMGSGKTISLAGPSVVLVYLIIGFMLFFVMRAMGELLLSNLHYRTFADFAADLLGPWAGFFTGWTYWFCWIVTAVADLVGITSYIQFWWPDLPTWIPALVTIVVLLGLNLLTVKAFGETEFWFAMIKIVAITALIVIGAVMLLFHFHSPDGTAATVSNLWNDGGIFPNGFTGFVAGFQIAIFAFDGLELVGTTAAETKDPRTTLPHAINSIPIRILLFYVLALLVIMSVTPWSEVDPARSPFVAMFTLAGLGIAASVVNFVVLTSAASSANSGIYSTSRMVFGLARQGQAPAPLGHLDRRLVPSPALFFSGVFLLSVIVLLAFGGSVIDAFTVVTTISSVLFIFVWSIILVSYIVYRRRRANRGDRSERAFAMPGGVVMCGVVLVFFGFVLWALTREHDTLEALAVTPLWFIALGIAWIFVRRRQSRVSDASAPVARP